MTRRWSDDVRTFDPSINGVSHAFDVIARNAFEESFFESLAEQSSKGKGKRRRSSASSQLLCAVGIKDESTARTIQGKLEECLTDPDWYDRSFAHMARVSR